jgi:hypothetical protein
MIVSPLAQRKVTRHLFIQKLAIYHWFVQLSRLGLFFDLGKTECGGERLDVGIEIGFEKERNANHT